MHIKGKEFGRLNIVYFRKEYMSGDWERGETGLSYGYQYKDRKKKSLRMRIISFGKLFKTEQTDHLLMRSSLT